MDYTYGTKNDEIDEFFKSKRPWSRVKDKIVSDYIDCYLKTVPRRGHPILIVDAFAGPGRFGDDSDGSPLIVCKAVTKAAHRGVIGCLFADSHPAHRKALKESIAEHIESGISEAPLADCSEALSRALTVGKGSTLFFYLDPYGIKDLDFEMVRQIYERNPQQSTEVLINFSFPTFMRMSGNWEYGDTPFDVAEKVKKAKTETVHRVMGGDYWLPIITDTNLSKIEREDAVVGAYVDRVRQFFKYSYSVPVKCRDDAPGAPADDVAKYHLIFGTRSAKAVVYMNDVAYGALEPYFNDFKDGLLFDLTPERYVASSRNAVKDEIVEALAPQPLVRPAIYERIIPKHFMQYRKKEYRAMIHELVFTEGRLFRDPKSIMRKTQLNDTTMLSTTPWPGGEGP